MWGLLARGCGKDLASSSNKDEASSNCSLEALQWLNHHLKGFILFSINPIAATAAAQINNCEGSKDYFSLRLFNLNW